MKALRSNSKFIRIFSVLLALLIFAMSVIPASAATVSVSYSTHQQNNGWTPVVSNGDFSGKVGLSLRIEAIKASISGMDGGIMYISHLQDQGWESSWSYDGAISGTTGLSRRLEAVRFKLYGEIAKHYTIAARAHVQNLGWLDWVYDGQICGTTGRGLRLECIQLMLIPKNTSVPDWNSLMAKYPSGSVWNSSFHNVAWTCHGFALTLGEELTDTNPNTWGKAYNLNSLKPGDIIRFSRPHTIMVTAVNGDTITYVDSNWVGRNVVCWNQTISRSQLTSKFGRLTYVMVCPK